MRNQAIAKSHENGTGFFYGYFIVAASFLTLTVMWGSFYAFGVFFKPVLSEFGWSRATVSGAASLALAMNGLFSIAAGGLTDRFGPRLVMTACGFLTGIGLVMMSRVSSVWQLYLFYGIIIGTGMGGAFVPLASTVARWFVEKRGVMTGIIVAGVGIGAFVGPPVAAKFILTYNWRTAYMIMGFFVLGVVVLSARLLIRDPSEMGLKAYGEEKEPRKETAANTAMPVNGDFSLDSAMHTARFWTLAFAFFCFGFCLQSVMIHIVPHALELGLSPSISANMLAVVGGASILGKLIFGLIGDHVGNRNIFFLSFILMTAALLWLLSANETWMLFGFSALFGFAYGCSVVAHSPLVAELFGLKSHGLILGVVGLGVMLGGAAGPLSTGLIFDINGSYQSAFIFCSVMSAAGILLSLFVKILYSAAVKRINL